MADIDLKAATPDTSLPSTGFLFGADSQSAASPSVYSTQTVATALLGSTSLTGATVTTSSPVLDLAQTWNAGAVAFTGLRYNATDTASASGSLLMDLQVGGSSRFKVNKSGQVLFGTATGSATEQGIFASNWLSLGGTNSVTVAQLRSGEFVLSSATIFTWASNTSFSSADLFLTRRAAANLQLGAADAASPVPQFLTAQGGSGTNIAGANFTIQGSRSTGNAAGGSIVFQVTPLGGAGSGANAYETALRINSASLVQFGGTTSSFPALKRSSTVLQSRLADDSDFAPLQGQLRSHANAVAETPTATHTITIYDAAGTGYKVLCVAA